MKNRNIPSASMPKGGKKVFPANGVVESSDPQYPTWKFCRFDRDGTNQISNLSLDCIKAIVQKLGNFETMNWSQIQQAGHGKNGKSNNHFVVPQDDFTSRGMELFSNLQLEEFSSQMFSLRLEGKQRLIGIREGKVFNIVWYDDDHSIVKSDIQDRGKIRR